MRMIGRLGMGCLVAMLTCSAAFAQTPAAGPATAADAAAEAGNAEPVVSQSSDASRTNDNRKASITRATFDSLAGNARMDTIAGLLRDVIRAEGQDCPFVVDYQMFRRGDGYRTLKVKCKERQLFMVTVRARGSLTVTGGDGAIAPMFPSDGEIISLTGQRIDQYLTDQARTGANPEPEVPAPAPAPEEAAKSSPNLVRIGALVVFNIIVFGILFVALNRLFRPSKDTFDQLSRRLGGIGTEEKDKLIGQSREIYSDIFAHPDGFFIARGSHGKRRFFPTVLSAILYRDYGFKIREIKEQ